MHRPSKGCAEDVLSTPHSQVPTPAIQEEDVDQVMEDISDGATDTVHRHVMSSVVEKKLRVSSSP